MKHLFDFYTSYNQFYIYDKNFEGDSSSGNFWTENAVADRMAIEDGILGVGTECYGPVKGELELLKIENTTFNIVDYDHIVEAGIEIKSGFIQILNCPDSSVEAEASVEPGFYKVRVYSSNLMSVEGDEGEDYYRVEIWPEKMQGRNVLKRYI